MLSAVMVVFCLTDVATRERGADVAQKSPLHVRQSSRWVSANVGESVAFECFYDAEKISRVYWYRQKLGERPTIVATFYQYNRNGSFHGDYKHNPRFALGQEKTKNYLMISDVGVLDSATYYCMVSFMHQNELRVEFAEGSVLAVNCSSSNIQSLVHRSASGSSLTLNCTFQTAGCDGEPGVYWFRESEEENAGVIYTHNGEECVRQDTTHTCVYDLPLETPRQTFYCAVALCGHILFGNGTVLDSEDGAASLLRWCFLGGAFAIAMATGLVCTMTRTRLTGDASTPCRVDAREIRDEDKMYFPVLLRQERGDQTWSECVYYCKKK